MGFEKSYHVKKISTMDLTLGSSLVLVSILLTINIRVQSIALVYLAILLVLIGLAVFTFRFQAENHHLRNLWILSMLSLPLYPTVDSIFAMHLSLVTYRTPDPRLLATPAYVPLYWVLGVHLFGHVYLRCRGLTGRVWLSAFAAGLFSAVSTTIVEGLFNAMGFYQNTPSHWMIGHIPLYVPLGYLLAFCAFPVYLRYPVPSGFMLYGLVGTCWYLFWSLGL